MRYFEQVEGKLSLRESSNPFDEVLNQTWSSRPIMADWNGDGHMDLLLLAKGHWRLSSPGSIPDQRYCTVYLYQQHQVDGKSTLVYKDDSFFRNEGCRFFDGSGASFVDVDDDGDLDAIFGSQDGPLHVYERTSNGLMKPKQEVVSDSIPLDMIQLKGSYADIAGIQVPDVLSQRPKNFLHPVLADWDLDGDLDLALLHYPIYSELSRYFVHQADHTVKELPGPPNSSCPINFGRHFSVTDLDRDGKKDIIGFHGSGLAIVCLQNSSDFAVAKLQDIAFLTPFNVLENEHICQDCLYDETTYNWGSVDSFPSFLDWDGDGDIDMLRKNMADKVYLYEQLSNGTIYAHALPLPTARDFSAADFDRDGDVDIMIVPPNSDSCLYFERHGDGSLEQLFGTDNPFNALCKQPSGSTTTEQELFASLGDWDGDGETDLVVIDNYRVTLWKNQPMDTFVEVDEKNNPFARIGLSVPSDVTVVDVNHDGRPDVIVPPQSNLAAQWAALSGGGGYQPYTYFEHAATDLLVEQVGEANPFGKVDFNELLSTQAFLPLKASFLDIDDDGDLDLVHSELHYTRNDGNGQFTYLNRTDPHHPFLGIEDNKASCWTFVDWDKDGDLDLVQAYERGGRTLEEIRVYKAWVTQQVLEMVRNGTSRAECRAWAQKKGPQMRFYRNDGATFRELTGPDNPFHGIGPLELENSCPALVDLDKDGTLELVLGTQTGKLFYFEQKNGTFQRAAKSPFADISIQTKLGVVAVHPHFVDWDGDGDTDMVVAGTDKVQFFHRGTCEDDEDARGKRRDLNMTGFKVTSARGTGQCNCSRPFYGQGCELGFCPPGQRLDRHVSMTSNKKYEQWQVCVPCESGRFKNFSGNSDECSLCPPGQIPQNSTHCVPCPSGNIRSPDHPEKCVPCATGDVALAGAPRCTECQAGTAPNEDGSECVACPAGGYAKPRSEKCIMCPPGTVPNLLKNGCDECTGQNYSSEGDEVCQTCDFPSMILGEDNWCTPLYTILFILGFIFLALFILGIFGRLRLECLKRRLNKLVAAKNWQELHSTEAKPLEYGLWQRKACKVLASQKADVKSRSFQLGISLKYVFEKLEAVYEETARQVEWRMDEFGPVTKTGFFVKVRERKLAVDPEIAWENMASCEHSKDPNFHQVAGVLAYGPWALGKGLCCPRDGRPDCSIVDALETESDSARATWFLSWVWGYKFTTVTKALKRWWHRHQIVSGADGASTFMWWCVFVNNQFRMLEDGQTEAPADLFHVFGQQLEGIGKMLMCLDQMKNSQSIPTTVILPELEVDAIGSVKDLTQTCRVDAEKAKASVEADAEAIKEHIQKEHQSFEYVNQTVEQALWCEVIKFLEQSETSKSESEILQSTQTPDTTESSLSEKTLVQKDFQCTLQ